ncbi:hypothetical protein DT73_03210 [Mangrovibacter sp. MFB070]|nr:hypothetical protein DT73_03210 [Mangrovibacter sp. MFB070]
MWLEQQTPAHLVVERLAAVVAARVVVVNLPAALVAVVSFQVAHWVPLAARDGLAEKAHEGAWVSNTSHGAFWGPQEEVVLPLTNAGDVPG